MTGLLETSRLQLSPRGYEKESAACQGLVVVDARCSAAGESVADDCAEYRRSAAEREIGLRCVDGSHESGAAAVIQRGIARQTVVGKIRRQSVVIDDAPSG